MEIELTVECHLSDAEDESIVKMTAGTTVYAAASSPLPKELNQEERREYMLSNLIALTYSHAKSHIMSITALSPHECLNTAGNPPKRDGKDKRIATMEMPTKRDETALSPASPSQM